MGLCAGLTSSHKDTHEPLIAATGHDKSAYLGDLPRVLQLSWAESARWADTAEIAALTPCYTLNA